MDSVDLLKQQKLLIDLQAKEIEHLNKDAENIRYVVAEILKQLGKDAWNYNIDTFEEFLHKLLISTGNKTDYRFQTRDVEVRYLKDKYGYNVDETVS